MNIIFELKGELELAMTNMEIAKSLALRYRLEWLAKEAIASDENARTITFEGSALEAFENMVNSGIIKYDDELIISNPIGENQDMLSVIRDPGDMNWYLWEAILVDLDTASLLKLVPESVSVKARDINKETERAGHFSEPLRKLACEVEQCIEKFRKELDAHYAAEESKYMNQP